ncbi:hypothetical protein MTO96_046952 [Rhipicephalus appendiculatus]
MRCRLLLAAFATLWLASLLNPDAASAGHVFSSVAHMNDLGVPGAQTRLQGRRLPAPYGNQAGIPAQVRGIPADVYLAKGARV